ncbi:MAG: 7-carboxy-7-deazaguanine synthase [Gammaproteobacteria bacterium]|jgi:7-carboxy-7-deazaguanine synthase
MSLTKTKSNLASEIVGKLLRVNEIFLSLQGETSKSGLLTTFIRLTGCPLRCQYCDTAYAFYEGDKLSIKQIIDKISTYKTHHITVTGGEPLAQQNCRELLHHLCNKNYKVSLETSGAMDISEIDPRVKIILDLKTPGSGESNKNILENIHLLNKTDELKFVICNNNDYQWAKKLLLEMMLHKKCEVLFSPSHNEQDARQLADWVLQDQLPVRLQIQLHKHLWGDVRGK